MAVPRVEGAAPSLVSPLPALDLERDPPQRPWTEDRARVEVGETDTALPTHSGQSRAEPDTGPSSEGHGGPLLSGMLYCWQYRRQRSQLRGHSMGRGDSTRDKRSLGPGWGVQRSLPPLVYTG